MELQKEFLSKAKDVQSILTQQENALVKTEMTFRSLLGNIFGAPTISAAVGEYA